MHAATRLSVEDPWLSVSRSLGIWLCRWMALDLLTILKLAINMPHSSNLIIIEN